MPYEERIQRNLRREQPISRLFPNLITIAGLCCGLSAVRFAINDKWEYAVGFIIAAALIDGMDGRIARMLGATSLFGAQLDSLSDFVCFGVAPALVMYLWSLDSIGIRGVGWAIALFFAVCCALRLARFNTGLVDGKQEPWQKQFFVGVPSPAGGILCLWPIIIWLHSEETYLLNPGLVAVHVFLMGALMASRIPTFAGKNMRIKSELILPFTAVSAFIIVLFVIEPWWTISLLSFIYLSCIPISMRRYARLKRQYRVQVTRGGASSPE